MGSAEISKYTVHVGRLGALGVDRFVVLRHGRRSESGAEVHASSEIYFSDRFGAGGNEGLVDSGDAVQAYLPAGELSAWIDILRHEDPVYLHWSSDTPGEFDPDGIIHLATGPEPTGEGPIDLSP